MQILNFNIPREHTEDKDSINNILESKHTLENIEEEKNYQEPKITKSEDVNKSLSSWVFFTRPKESSSVKEFEFEELWVIWRKPYELHSFDYNIDLITLAQRYNDILNFITRDGFESYNHESFKSLTSHPSRVKILGIDDKKPTYKLVKKIQSKQELLNKNINFASMTSSVSPNKNSSSNRNLTDGTKSKEAYFINERIDSIKQKDKAMIDKTVRYRKIWFHKLSWH